jgi:transcriptional regulator with XRE-family HTH domain
MVQQSLGVASLERMGFDQERFFRALEDRRSREEISWRELARRLELSPSTFSRLSRGHRPDVDTFLTLLAWLDLPVERFMRGDGPGEASPNSEDPLGDALDLLRQDASLSEDSLDAIQDIVRIAYRRFSAG